MPVTYEGWLVALSIVMAIQGAYVGLTLAVKVGDAAGMHRRFLLAGAAFSLALAIWTMHFVGMLAVRVDFAVDYLVFPTLLSFLVCVIVVGAAVYATSSGPLTPLRLALSACLMGGGIFSMHYLGMSALHASATMVHAPAYVAGSMAFAVAASGLALWLAAGRGGRPPLLLSAVAFGIAISGMHYTAMTGMTLFPYAAASGAPALSTDLLAIVVAIVGFCVSGIFLLTLVPDHTRGGAKRVASGRDPAAEVAAPTPTPEMPAAVELSALGEAPAAVAPATLDGNGADLELGRGTYAPLGGAGAPRRFARHLPIERDGSRHFVAVEDVIAVHASAHYTYIFDGNDKLFCPLAIGDVESRLDDSRFVRVHRSHIVNIGRVAGYRRSGDSELVEMDAGHSYTVPVSRSRIGRLKALVASVTGADAAAQMRRRHHLAPQ